MTADVHNFVEQRLLAYTEILVAAAADTTDNHLLQHLEEKLLPPTSSWDTQSIGFSEKRKASDDFRLEEVISLLKRAQTDSAYLEDLPDLKVPECIVSSPPAPSAAQDRESASRQSCSPKVTRPDGFRRSSRDMQQEPPGSPPPSADQLREFMEREDSYPKIGPGYSDEISVVSDLTIPTVVTGVPVPEEEYYGAPPRQLPMNMGSGSGHNRRRNLVNAVKPQQPPQMMMQPQGVPPQQRRMVPPSATSAQMMQAPPGPQAQRPRAVQRSGGAAAKRLKNYEQAMAKLGDGGGFGHEYDNDVAMNDAYYGDGNNYFGNGGGENFFAEDNNSGHGGERYGMPVPGAKPKRAPVPTRSGGGGGGVGPSGGPAGAPKKNNLSPLARKANVNQAIDMNRAPNSKLGPRSPKDLEWQPPFGNPNGGFAPTKSEDPLLIDEDGFLVSEMGGDPFKSAEHDPFVSSSSGGAAAPSSDPFVNGGDPFAKQRSFGSSPGGSDPFSRSGGDAGRSFGGTDPFSGKSKTAAAGGPAVPGRSRTPRRLSNQMMDVVGPEDDWVDNGGGFAPDPRQRRSSLTNNVRPRRPGPQ